MAKSVLCLALLLGVSFTLVYFQRIIPVSASGPVYIRSDGSIDPPTANIARSGDFYTLTGSIATDGDGIWIERSNMTLDGTDHTLLGPGTHAYPGGGQGIRISGQVNVTIKNIRVEEFYTGILVANQCFGCTIEDTTIVGNDQGISVYGCDNISISGNTVAGIEYGIEFEGGRNSTIIWNNVVNSSLYGIALTSYSQSDSVMNNIIEKNGYGVVFNSALNNTVSENNIAHNGEGIRLLGSNGSRIFHNNFDENTKQFLFMLGSSNVWDNGYPDGGNYWSDYLVRYPNAKEIDSSGIWNTSYLIDANNVDRYPLMRQAVIPEFPSLVIQLLSLLLATGGVMFVHKKRSE